MHTCHKVIWWFKIENKVIPTHIIIHQSLYCICSSILINLKFFTLNLIEKHKRYNDITLDFNLDYLLYNKVMTNIESSYLIKHYQKIILFERTWYFIQIMCMHITVGKPSICRVTQNAGRTILPKNNAWFVLAFDHVIKLYYSFHCLLPVAFSWTCISFSCSLPTTCFWT